MQFGIQDVSVFIRVIRAKCIPTLTGSSQGGFAIPGGAGGGMGFGMCAAMPGRAPGGLFPRMAPRMASLPAGSYGSMAARMGSQSAVRGNSSRGVLAWRDDVRNAMEETESVGSGGGLRRLFHGGGSFVLEPGGGNANRWGFGGGRERPEFRMYGAFFGVGRL